MQRTSSFLLGLALLSLGWAAQAQTTPASQPKTPAVKGQPRSTGAAAPKSVHPFIKDTAAFNRKFRRSGRPTDGMNRLPLPKQ